MHFILFFKSVLWSVMWVVYKIYSLISCCILYVPAQPLSQDHLGLISPRTPVHAPWEQPCSPVYESCWQIVSQHSTGPLAVGQIFSWNLKLGKGRLQWQNPCMSSQFVFNLNPNSRIILSLSEVWTLGTQVALNVSILILRGIITSP